MQTGTMFALLQFTIAAYLLYSAVTGKGQLYRLDNVKKGMEEKYKKTMRAMAWILFPLMVAQGVMDLLRQSSEDPMLHTLNMALWGVTMAVIVVLVILTARMTSREPGEKSTPNKTASSSIPRAAFEFDDEETDKR